MARVPRHPVAHAALAILNALPVSTNAAADIPEPMDSAVARAARLVHAGNVSSALPIMSPALNVAPQGNGGWLLPIEPLLGVRHDPDPWAPALAVLRLRALKNPALPAPYGPNLHRRDATSS